MPHSGRLAAAALVALLGGACSRPDSGAERSTPPPDLTRVEPARASVISGRVTLDGPVPENAPIRMASDPVCARAHAGGARSEAFVSERGGLGNVFVYVKDGVAGYAPDPPAEAVTLKQSGCQFQPHVLGVRVGQNVEFVNSDATVHSVHATGDANPEFTLGRVTPGQKSVRYFSTPEVMVRITCDVHDWMSAYLGVLDHPYFAVTTARGSFDLKGLPAGRYTVEAWHEKLGTRTQAVDLADGEKETLAFAFEAPTLP